MPVATSCEQGSSCLNSVEHKGLAQNKCFLCRLAPGNENLSQQFWKPGDRSSTHPVLRAEQFEARRNTARQKAQNRLNRDRKKIKVQREARRAETVTERSIIHATRNSGRSNRDGDHVAADSITLDTKNQSQRENPVVLLAELSKVRGDARRAGKRIGGLVLRNQHGVGVIVFDEQEFAREILSRL